jgi:DNA repair exonuclease SbcCD nuclease subunit
VPAVLSPAGPDAYPDSGDGRGTLERLVVAHTSDLHIGHDGGDRGLGGLHRVLEAAEAARADVLLLAGDIFDHNRIGETLLDDVAEALARARTLAVVLPGNHDPLLEDAAYRRLRPVAGLHVLGLDADVAELSDFDLEVRGRPHTDYHDMHPLPEPATRAQRRSVVMAHGHYVAGPNDLHRAWLIHDHDIAALGADYVALGHWDRRERVGGEGGFAYYSGSPDLARTVNVIRFGTNGGAPTVAARSLADGAEMSL